MKLDMNISGNFRRWYGYIKVSWYLPFCQCFFFSYFLTTVSICLQICFYFAGFFWTPKKTPKPRRVGLDEAAPFRIDNFRLMAHARSQRNVCKSVTWNFPQFQVSAPERWCGGAESREMSHRTMPDGETSIKELVPPPPPEVVFVLPCCFDSTWFHPKMVSLRPWALKFVMGRSATIPPALNMNSPCSSKSDTWLSIR